MLDAFVPLEGFQYNFNRDNDCCVCQNNRGFSTLCNTGDSEEHRLCLGCVMDAYQKDAPQLLCPTCRSPFNMQDYLVVRELHLIHSLQEHVWDYFHTRQSNQIPKPNKLYLEDFLWLGEKDQKKMISKMYWGNDCLFDEVDDYPKDIAKNKRIKENLLEMLGNLWSPQLGRKEKDQKLIEVFTDGWLVKSCQNETKETFLHRCHLFLRAFVPLHTGFNRLIDIRIQRYAKYFFDYGIRRFMLMYSRMNNLTVVERPATGPLDVESICWGFLSHKHIMLNLNLLELVPRLKKYLKELLLFNVGILFIPAIVTFVGYGYRHIIGVISLQSALLTIVLICGFLYYKYFTDSISKQIDLLYFMKIQAVVVTAIVIASLSFIVT